MTFPWLSPSVTSFDGTSWIRNKGTWQGDAGMLATRYSGWYNGLARMHYLDVKKGKEAEHGVIVYCKANPDQLVIEPIAVVFKDMQAKLGIEMKH